MAEQSTYEQMQADLQNTREYTEKREKEEREFQSKRNKEEKDHQLELERKRIRLESIRLAKETLIENSRSKSIDERDVSADDIKNFANILYNFVND